MHELMAFVLGTIAGAGVTAIYWRRAAAELGKLRQEIVKEKNAIGSRL